MRYGLKSGPRTYPVSEAELADLLRLDSYEDPTFKFILHTATEAVIAYTGRALLEQTFTIQFEGYPGTGTETLGLDRLYLVPNKWIELPYPPLISVQSVKIVDQNGDEDVIPSTDYRLDLINEPGRLNFKGYWPNMGTDDFLTIAYTAGYGDNPNDVPFGIRHGILMTAAYLYEHRGDCESGAAALMQSGASSVLTPYRIMRL
jgi:uncharacterized phiE125 gp8 family phage protein